MWEYIRRGITRRKRQTLIIAIGMALAVAAVVVVSAASRGIAAAQSSVLESVYGVGTDLTVTAAVAEPGESQSGEEQSGGRQEFEFGKGAGDTGDDGQTDLSTTRLTVGRGTSTLEGDVLGTVASADGVAAATGTLALTQIDFSGQVQQQEDSGTTTQDGSTDQQGAGQAPDGQGEGGGGGMPGFGGGSFSFGQTTILGVDPTATEVGPTAGMTVSDGELLSSADQDAAVISATYASDNELAVGDTVTLGADSTEVPVVGVLSEESSQDASDIYIPLSLAQSLSGEDNAITTIYVKADSAESVETVATTLGDSLDDVTVSTQSDLADTVTGSLSSAATWISGFGRWLTIGILALAFLLTSLFTISSVTRRTRELGTLKAIGWSNWRVLGNVTAETLIQTLIGGLAGLALGAVAILGVNAAGVTLSGSAGDGFQTGGPGMSQEDPGGGGAPGSQGSQDQGDSPDGSTLPDGAEGEAAAADTGTSTTLVLEPSATTVGLAVGAALLGGVVAGGAASVAVSRLRPAAALRSVE